MLKGTSQEKRDAGWHKRHLLKLTGYRRRRPYRLLRYRMGGRTIDQAKRLEKKYLANRNLPSNLTFWERIKLFFLRLFSFKKLTNA